MRNKLIFCIVIITIITCIFFRYNKIDNLITRDYESRHYVNDLYNSKEIYYRTILKEDEKEIYENILDAIIKFKTKINLERSNNFYLDVNNLSKITDAVMLDHPELFYYGYPTFKSNMNGSITIEFNYVDSNEYDMYLSKIKNIIDDIKRATIEMNTYDKVKYVYEYLGNKNTYGNIHSIEGQTALSAFLDELSPVCAGYAKASEIIFKNIGVDSLLVKGDLKSGFFVGDSHLWNLVKIGKYYYVYDVTQSSITKSISNNISYVGLLSMKKSDYSYSYKEVIPFIRYNMNYYDMNNLSYTYKNSNINELNEILNTNKKYVEVKVKNIDALYLNFNKIKKSTKIIKSWRFNDIILFEKGD